MKSLILLVIRIYWTLVPKSKRRPCLFRTSCSRHVYQVTNKEGLLKGLVAFKYRFRNCRGNFLLFTNSYDGSKNMIMPGGGTLKESEISERFLKGI